MAVTATYQADRLVREITGQSLLEFLNVLEAVPGAAPGELTQSIMDTHKFCLRTQQEIIEAAAAVPGGKPELVDRLTGVTGDGFPTLFKDIYDTPASAVAMIRTAHDTALAGLAQLLGVAQTLIADAQPSRAASGASGGR